MRVAIVGGTGTLGQLVARELAARGHEVRALSRSSEHRVDLRTGEGLPAALTGCTTVVDASNDASSTRRAGEVLVDGTRRLLDAERAAEVAHHLCVSIVGCDAVPLGYFRVKAAQEQAVAEGAVPWTVVRATQFHEFLVHTFATAGRWGVLPLPRGTVQPLAAVEAAHALAELAEQDPRHERIEVAGPEIDETRHFARTWRTMTSRRTALPLLPLPGTVGGALRAGALTTPHPTFRGTVTFADRLAEEGA